MAFLDNELDREILAVEALSLIEEEKVSEREALKRISNLHNITDWKIRSTLHALLFETLRYRNLIDFIINSVMEKGTIEKIKSVFLRNILRIGVYQIKIIKKQINLICNTLVELVKKKSSKRAANFVNAILRSAERFDLESELDKLNKKEYLALKYSHPKWFIELLSPYFSDEFIVSLM
ncbi:MAG: transcription antitermination factor NusB, partial [Candidatus Helarchaeota archaeon]